MASLAIFGLLIAGCGETAAESPEPAPAPVAARQDDRAGQVRSTIRRGLRLSLDRRHAQKLCGDYLTREARARSVMAYARRGRIRSCADVVRYEMADRDSIRDGLGGTIPSVRFRGNRADVRIEGESGGDTRIVMRREGDRWRLHDGDFVATGDTGD